VGKLDSISQAKLVLTILLLVFLLNCSLCKSEHGGR
jgi:hypothetical protein